MEKLTKKQYLAIRLALWFIAVVIAAIPSMKGTDSFHELLEGESFRDLLFIVVPVSALGLSSTFDYLFTAFPDLTGNEFFNSFWAILINGGGIITGLVGFISIQDGPLTPGQLWTYSALTAFAIFAGFVTEVIATMNHRGFKTPPGGGAAPRSPSVAPHVEHAR